MSSAHTINRWLDGSPYVFPSDLDGEARASELLNDQLQIKDRQSRVQAAFAEQADELRAEVDRDFDLRLVFESNAIEGVSTSFAETRAFLETADSRFVSDYSFSRGVVADPKLLEVIGHEHALQFVKGLAPIIHAAWWADGCPSADVPARQGILTLSTRRKPNSGGHSRGER